MAPSVLRDIVKSYDVRGLVATQLTPEIAGALGAAFVDVIVGAGETLVLGHDMRDSSPVLAEAFIEGALSRGAHVRNIGLCSTDMVYFASGSWDMPAVMFTASHNPARYNGIKFSRRLAQGISIDTGLAEIRDRAEVFEAASAEPFTGPAGTLTHHSVLADYASYVRSLVPLEKSRALRVVVDAANGMAGLSVPAVLGDGAGLKALPFEVIPIYFELDGTFPNHEANPLDPANLVDLQAAVIKHTADIGLAFDGDADRCFVIDERGEPVTPSAVAALVAKREILRVRGAGEPDPIKVIHNLICSRTVSEVIAENGAVPVRTQVGHSFIKDTMRDSGAIFGGEHSAHYYFRDFWGAGNGMLAALHVLAELGLSTAPLSSVVAEFSRYYESGEINSVVSDQSSVIERIHEHYSSAHYPTAQSDRMDGLSIWQNDAEGFWSLNVRASNTELLLRLNVEASTEARMVEVRDAVLGLIRA
ncbi:MAG: phosphomannomutase/phosphoglucomutase [Pontimonas sp.]|nr:phosphomannomutase/phosphoglucomutase [Pontimonas sp.]